VCGCTFAAQCNKFVGFCIRKHDGGGGARSERRLPCSKTTLQLIQKLKLHHREAAAECFAKSPRFGAVHILLWNGPVTSFISSACKSVASIVVLSTCFSFFLYIEFMVI
jgi:hypothetical protein